ncbi:MAG: hypothetical protein RIC38_04935, partial [Chromatocurvus sp.]
MGSDGGSPQNWQQEAVRLGVQVPARVTAFIDGQCVAHNPDAHTLPIVYPGTAESVSTLQESSPDEVAAAVAAAR